MAKRITISAGIDTGKRKLDVALDGRSEQMQVGNTPEGYMVLVEWLRRQKVKRVGIEASGGYEQSVVAELRARFATVVIDTTPIGAVADFKLVSQQCDGVLMVVRPDHTSRKTLAKAFEIAEKQNLLGVVVNAFKDWFLWSAHEQYGYYLGRGDENKFSSQ